MIYEAQVSVKDTKHLKLLYSESIQPHQLYNLFVRCSRRKMEFFSNINTPLGFVEIDGLKMKEVEEDTQSHEDPTKTEDGSKKDQSKEPKIEANKESNQQHDKIYNKESKHIQGDAEEKESQPEREEHQKQLAKSRSKQLLHFQFYEATSEKEGSGQNVILDIYTQSKGFVSTLKWLIETKTNRATNPLSFTPNKNFNTSLLSSESPEQRYRGFLNLAMILLVVLNFRNIVVNLKKYGIQTFPTEVTLHLHSLLFIIFGLGFHVVLCYAITHLQFSKSLSKKQGTWLNGLNVVWLLLSNIIYSYTMDPGFVMQTGITMLTVIVSMKLISYIHVNNTIVDLAESIKNKVKVDEQSSKPIDQSVKKEVEEKVDNLVRVLSISRLAYFLIAPTLCYQLEYPRNAYIRKIWLGKRLVEYLLTSLVMNILVIQYIFPELEQLRKCFKSHKCANSEFAFKIVEVSVPVMLFWVLMFYSVFHVFLNILAEITRFGDRAFYSDWWNCKDHEEYWKKWNLPVHNWMLRHVYIPLTGEGVPKATASFAVFFVSAVLHEYWIGVPLRVISFWAFMAIMIQAPLIAVQKFLEKKLRISNSELGNLVFWISFCFVGQPLVAFAYYYLFTSKK